jgi:hypothetical protein
MVERSPGGGAISRLLMSFIMLNLVGRGCVDDLEVVDKDDGFGRLLRRIENYGLFQK